MNDWTEWHVVDKCSDNCFKEKIQRSRNRTCYPTNICKLPISGNRHFSGGVIDGSFIWYCRQSMCKGSVATETDRTTFDTACPCETCSGKYTAHTPPNTSYPGYIIHTLECLFEKSIFCPNFIVSKPCHPDSSTKYQEGESTTSVIRTMQEWFPWIVVSLAVINYY